MIKSIILLGRPKDEAISSLKNFLKRKSVPVIDGRSIKFSDFGINLNTVGIVSLKLNNEKYNISRDMGLGIFVRTPSLIIPVTKGRLSRFIFREYFSSIWAICGIGVNVINKPANTAWNYDQVLRRSLYSRFLSQYKTDRPFEILNTWNKHLNFELHIEDLVSGERRIFEKNEANSLNKSFHNGSYRAIFSPSSNYMVFLFVGKWHKLVLNEFEFNLQVQKLEKFLERTSKLILNIGIRFFALVLTFSNKMPSVVKVIPDPPFDWYRDFEDVINEKILNEFEFPSISSVPINLIPEHARMRDI